MFLRHGLAIGFLAALAGGGPARAETRTLAEALAAAYSNNPVVAGRPRPVALRGRERAAGTGRLAAAGQRVRQWRPRTSTPPSCVTAGTIRRARSHNTRHQQLARHQHAQISTSPSRSGAAARPGPTPTRREPGHGPARPADRHRAAGLHQRHQRLCQRHRRPAAAGAEHQQRAGAGPPVAGHQRPLPRRRDHPHRRGPGRSGAGRRHGHPRDRRGQPADRARRSSSRSSASAAGELVEPQPLRLPVHSERKRPSRWPPPTTRTSSPRCSTTPRRRTLSTPRSRHCCHVSLQGQTFQQNNIRRAEHADQRLARSSRNLTVPIYQGGPNMRRSARPGRAAADPASLIDDARRTAVQQAVQAWDTLVAAKAAADSTRAQIRANEIALEGVRARGDRRQPHHAGRAERDSRRC